MPDRVRVFIDYQNTYHAARDLYHESLNPHWVGQFHPGALGRLLVERSRFDRALDGVFIYRGLPSGSKDPKGYGAARAQLETWSRDRHVRVITRSLRYPPDWPKSPAKEKGIDVAMAIDVVMGAVRDEYDVGIVISRDTDLRPALETVLDDCTQRIEVAAWHRSDVHCGRLSLPQRKLWCHWIDEDDYRRLADDHDYTTGSRPASSP